MKSTHRWSVLLILLWAYIMNPGDVEGYFFPVVAQSDLVAVEDPTDPEWTRVSGPYRKLRGNCSPRRVEWFVGSREAGNAPADFMGGKQVFLPQGDHTFIDWRVRAAPPKVLMEQSFADVIHRCFYKIPFVDYHVRSVWETRSRLWR